MLYPSSVVIPEGKEEGPPTDTMKMSWHPKKRSDDNCTRKRVKHPKMTTATRGCFRSGAPQTRLAHETRWSCRKIRMQHAPHADVLAPQTKFPCQTRNFSHWRKCTKSQRKQWAQKNKEPFSMPQRSEVHQQGDPRDEQRRAAYFPDAKKKTNWGHLTETELRLNFCPFQNIVMG